MCILTYLGHLQITKLVPEILDGVQAKEGSTEHTDPLDTAHATNRETAHGQPESPLGRERLALKTVPLGPAEDGCEGEEEQHRVEQDESADGRVRVLEQNHHCDEPDSRLPEVQLFRSVVCQGNAESTEGCVELAHESVVELWRVCLARLEFECSVVACEPAR